MSAMASPSTGLMPAASASPGATVEGQPMSVPQAQAVFSALLPRGKMRNAESKSNRKPAKANGHSGVRKD
jgi:hypothetical protein